MNGLFINYVIGVNDKKFCFCTTRLIVEKLLKGEEEDRLRLLDSVCVHIHVCRIGVCGLAKVMFYCFLKYNKHTYWLRNWRPATVYELLRELGGYLPPKSIAPADITPLVSRLLRVNGAPLFDFFVDVDLYDRSRSSVFLDLPTKHQEDAFFAENPQRARLGGGSIVSLVSFLFLRSWITRDGGVEGKSMSDASRELRETVSV
ncbi:hypothetical protein WN48_02375 [Eufriesea mexicana]|nr:hypothetical protein WN48_02375 [Eufriesea mexicana]